MITNHSSGRSSYKSGGSNSSISSSGNIRVAAEETVTEGEGGKERGVGREDLKRRRKRRRKRTTRRKRGRRRRGIRRGGGRGRRRTKKKKRKKKRRRKKKKRKKKKKKTRTNITERRTV